MKKLVFLLLAWLSLAAGGYAYTQRDLLQRKADLSTLKKYLSNEQQWVAYPAYTDRIGWDRLLGDSKAEYIRRGEKRLAYQWQLVRATDYLEFERSGDRGVMQNGYQQNNAAIADLLMAELAEGKGRFTDQLVNGVYLSCEMTSWALSAHLSAQHSGRSLPDYREQVIDLTSGDLGALLSWTYYFMQKEFDKIDPVISLRLRHELQVRILDPYMKEDRFWWMALRYKPGMLVNNWNPWCNSNVLQCFLLLEEDPAKRAEAVYRTMVSVDRFINYNHADGGCEEGPSYWGHAAGKMYDYLQLLSDATGGHVSIFDDPMIRNMGEYICRSYVGNGWVVNFADASAKGGGDEALIFRYGKATGSQEMMRYAAYLAEQRTTGQPVPSGSDLYRTLQTLVHRRDFASVLPLHQTPDCVWYPETQFCYMQNKQGFFVAAKGGFNNESHNHNDVGSFSLYIGQQPVLIDAGVGTYTRQTFGRERYTIWTMQSDYHNLPRINGVSQRYGSRYRAADVSCQPSRKRFSADIAGAYPAEAAVCKWVRSYTLRQEALRIEDTFELKEMRQPNRISFLTWGQVDLSVAGEVHIQVNGVKAVLSYDKNSFSPVCETIRLQDKRLSNVWGPEIFRITLEAKKQVLRGKYTYTVRTVK